MSIEMDIERILNTVKTMIESGHANGQKILRLVNDYSVRQHYVGGMYNTDIILKAPIKVKALNFSFLYTEIEFEQSLEAEVLRDLCLALNRENPMKKAFSGDPYDFKCCISISSNYKKRVNILFMELPYQPVFAGNRINFKNGLVSDVMSTEGHLAGNTFKQPDQIKKSNCKAFKWLPEENAEPEVMISFWY